MIVDDICRPIHSLYAESLYFLWRNTTLAVGLAFGLLLSFGFAMTSVSISVDEELHLISNQNDAWMRQGRFAITLEKWIFDALYPLPFLNIAVSLILIFLSAVVWMAFFEQVSKEQLRSTPALALTAFFYATLPVNAYFMSFNTYNVEVSFGLLLSALAARSAWKWFVDSESWSFFAISAGCALLAAGTYQSLLFVSIIGLIIAQAVDILTSEPATPRRFRVGPLRNLWTLAPLGIGALVSVGLSEFVLPSDSYTDNFLAWGKLDQDFVLMRLKYHLLDTLTGTSVPGGQVIALTAFAGGLLLLLSLVRSLKTWDCTVPLLTVALFCLPFLLSVALGTPLPFRAQQALPLSFGGFWVLLYLVAPKKRLVNMVLLPLAVLVLIWNAEANTRLSFTEYVTYERDKTLGNRLAGMLNDEGWTGQTMPLAVIGDAPMSRDRFSEPSETIGRSLFTWDHGGRAAAFMNAIGYGFYDATPTQREQATRFAASMPVWPLTGSATLHEGVAIVNFGPPSK